MNGFTENRAHGASERPGRDDVVLAWGACRAMLPLVGRIAQDIVSQHGRLARLRPEQARLERNRRTLDWPGRARRYQLQEEVAAVERELHDALAELEVLGLTLLDPVAGLIGFPTVVNDRRAFFSWQLGETALDFWSYAGDTLRRRVPEAWTAPPKERPARKPRNGKR